METGGGVIAHRKGRYVYTREREEVKPIVFRQVFVKTEHHWI